MTQDEQSSDGDSIVKTDLELATAVERFHARKFGAKTEKRGVLKVNSTTKAKKQKAPVKTNIQGALKLLEPEEMEAVMTQTRTGRLNGGGDKSWSR
jgi:hypothetical protein